MTTTQTYYAIELPKRLKPGETYLAAAPLNAGPQLFHWRAMAVAYRRKVFGHCKAARVVKVALACAWS